MIELRSRDEIAATRPAGRFVAEALTALEVAARPGVSLLDLDFLAPSMIRDRDAASCYMDYHPSFGAMPYGPPLGQITASVQSPESRGPTARAGPAG